jgi:tellurium resistance protein TerZ
MAISLQKGQRISLSKEGKSLSNVCIGVNWGAIEKKGLFGKMKKIAVDLDASVGLYSEDKQLIDRVFFGKLTSDCGAIVHSGDDLTGDMEGDDGLDNEVIVLNLPNIKDNVAQVVFVLNSFEGQDFATIPFASIRIYEGTPDRVDEIFATFDIANDTSFSGKVSMIMGKLYRHSGTWKFTSIGDSTNDRKLEQTLQTASAQYL